MIDTSTFPIRMAFDAEMVVGFSRQAALAGARFEQALCQGNAGRYLVFVLLLDRQRAVCLDVPVVSGGRRPMGGRCSLRGRATDAD